MMISMVFENVQLDGGLRYNIPKYKYSFLEISPDLESNGTLMQVSVSLKDIVDGGLDQLDPQKLPGGRNLPGVASGSLPAVAFSIEKFHNMSLYLGKDVLVSSFQQVSVLMGPSLHSDITLVKKEQEQFQLLETMPLEQTLVFFLC
jgi:hypothetical protein